MYKDAVDTQVAVVACACNKCPAVPNLINAVVLGADWIGILPNSPPKMSVAVVRAGPVGPVTP
jgi:hypothetical protein